ncbi:MAG: NADH-quinone oxidoreductase subunit C [bacterium]
MDNAAAPLADLLREKLKDFLDGDITVAFGEPVATVSRSSWDVVSKKLKEDPDLTFDYLRNLTAVDWITHFEMVYNLYSFNHNYQAVIKSKVSKEFPVIASAANVWHAADWHEREVYDLFGIEFIGHPDLRRILLPEDWEGHPLRKDYPIQGPLKERPVRWDDMFEKYRKEMKGV